MVWCCGGSKPRGREGRPHYSHHDEGDRHREESDSGSNSGSESHLDIDEGLISRQLYVLGKEAQAKLGKTDVLLFGLDGLGVEVAKNVVLAGVRSVTVHDPTKTSMLDLSSQFYLTEKDVGKSRAEVSLPKLKELNSYVQVDIVREGTTLSDVFKSWEKRVSKNHNGNLVVVACNYGFREELEELNNECQSLGRPAKFIMAEVHGVYASLFCDFGDVFQVTDVSGKQQFTGVVTDIVKEGQKKTTFVLTQDRDIDLEIGSFCRFEGIQSSDRAGQKKANSKAGRYKVVAVDKALYCVTVKGFPDIGTYHGRGQLVEIPLTEELQFERLSKCQKQLPKDQAFYLWDYAKIERAPLLHVYRQALHEFRDKQRRFPKPKNSADASTIVALCEKFARGCGKEFEDALDKDIVTALASGSMGVISPMCAFIGGIASQEVLKTTGKFRPIHQWFYFDAIEILPPKSSSWFGLGESSNFAPINSRYDAQIAVIGRKAHEELQKQAVFLVGAGALGCEYLKGFAMTGLGTKRKVIVTDMDSIEKSNLNRQFLFRDDSIGKMKSQVAAKAVKAMNRELSVEAMTDPVGPDTKKVFSDAFWNEQDLILTALDNVEARRYVDSRCVFYLKPLIDTGTTGTLAHSEVYIPQKTVSYSTEQDAPTQQTPQCTIRRFPFRIEHCIEWARDLFGGYFENTPSAVRQLSDAGAVAWVDSERSKEGNTYVKRIMLEQVWKALTLSKSASFDDCVKEARLIFEELFANDIKQLLFNFPKDAKTSKGEPFWSGSKRAPNPIKFDIDDDEHRHFVIATAHLLADTLGVSRPKAGQDGAYWKALGVPLESAPAAATSRSYLRDALSKVSVPGFKPESGVVIQTEEGDGVSDGKDDDYDAMNDHFDKIENLNESFIRKLKAEPSKFEKDDDTNFHIEFVKTAANLRARNYAIPEANRSKTKLIAGSIIPAIATTTAAVTGLAMLEVYKLVQQKELSSFKCTNLNLACPTPESLVQMWEPREAPKAKPERDEFMMVDTVPYPPGWTLWDKILIDKGNLKLKDLLSCLKSQHGITVTSLVSEKYWLWHGQADKARLDMKITDLIEHVANKTDSKSHEIVTPGQEYLELSILGENAKGQDLSMPPLVLKIR